MRVSSTLVSVAARSYSHVVFIFSVVELTGDVTPDMRAISKADVIVTTPEKWDGVSRSWQTRNYVQDVALLVIDEIHLLGDERGPVLEVIVSRTNFISSHTEQGVRVVGLSTALANARDLADWLGIKQVIGQRFYIVCVVWCIWRKITTYLLRQKFHDLMDFYIRC